MPQSPQAIQTRKRIGVLRVLFFLALFGLGMKVVDTHIRKGEFLAKKAEQDYSRSVKITGDRGRILDRNLTPLGTNIDMVNVTADPRMVQNKKATAKILARILGMDTQRLVQALSKKGAYALLARNIAQDEARKIREKNLRGIFFENSSKRFYPNREMAAQVLGFTGWDGAGREGLEYRYNSQLSGKTIEMERTAAGNGRYLEIDNRKKAELAGNSLVLTLDKQIQFLTEKTLENTVKTHRAKSGMALVLRPATGELLAVAHYPAFNPNTEVDYKQGLWRNRAATDAFEPGSAMKVFTVAAALEKGLTPNTLFNCENGKYRVGRYTIKDTHAYEILNMRRVIQVSSNIGSAKMAEIIGPKALHQYLTRFGFGKKPGSGSPGETAGTLAPYSQWAQIDLDAIAFGQGIAVSAIQLIAGMGAIANDGVFMKPMLIKKIISRTGEDVKVFNPENLGRVISTDTAREVKTMMAMAVDDEGTGPKARLDGYPVCGKTGTAQKTAKGQKGYLKNRYTSVFAGFAPKDQPRLAALVVVDEPRNKYYGGDVAAPAFKTIMAQSFNYLNIPPAEPRQMVATLTQGEHP